MGLADDESASRPETSIELCVSLKPERVDSMNMSQIAAVSVRLLLTLFLIAAPLSAQRRRPAAPKPPPPAKPAQPALTFETILAADSYKVYGEVRGVGQLLRSAGVSDILDPVMKLAAPPKEFKTLVRWLNSHADELMTSRLMFAAWASRPNLPQALFVIEFPSTEEAQKFEPQAEGVLAEVSAHACAGEFPAVESGKE